jgi:hypothetical protein
MIVSYIRIKFQLLRRVSHPELDYMDLQSWRFDFEKPGRTANPTSLHLIFPSLP